MSSLTTIITLGLIRALPTPVASAIVGNVFAPANDGLNELVSDLQPVLITLCVLMGLFGLGAAAFGIKQGIVSTAAAGLGALFAAGALAAAIWLAPDFIRNLGETFSG